MEKLTKKGNRTYRVRKLGNFILKYPNRKLALVVWPLNPGVLSLHMAVCVGFVSVS